MMIQVGIFGFPDRLVSSAFVAEFKFFERKLMCEWQKNTDIRNLNLNHQYMD